MSRLPRPRRPAGRSAATWALAAVVAALGVAAGVDALRGHSGRAPAGAGSAAQGRQAPSATRPGPEEPPPGRLRGTLWLEEADGCRLRSFSLAGARPGPVGPATGCALWVAPSGRAAVVTRSRAPLGGLARLWLVELGREARLVLPLGRIRGEASWSPDSSRVAWCDGRGAVVLDVASGQRTRVRGCRPQLAPDGSVLTRPDRALAAALWRDGRVLLSERDVRAAFPTPARGGLVDVLGYGAGRSGLVALSAVQFRPGRKPRVVLQVWRGHRNVAAVPLPGFGEPTGPFKGLGRVADAVEFSPDGRELAVASREKELELRVLSFGTWREVAGRHSQRAFGWSPDGVWLALATVQGVLVYGPARGEAAAYALPLDAAELAWRA